LLAGSWWPLLRQHYAAAGVKRTLRVYSKDGNTFMRELTSRPPSWKCDVKSKIRLP